MTDDVYVYSEGDNLKQNLVCVTKPQSKYVIPASVVTIVDGEIDSYAFKVAKTTSFELSFAENSELVTIGSYAFYECNQLTSVDFTNAQKLRTIKNFAFRYCSKIKSLTFPKSLYELGYYGTFDYCYKLSSVTFPDDSVLEIISGGTFSHSSLTTFRIPSHVREIGGESFAGTPIRDLQNRMITQSIQFIMDQYIVMIFQN